jgi:hypothetical protein
VTTLLRAAAIVVLALAATGGCGPAKPRPNYGTLELVEGSGRITLDGRPLAGAEVRALGEDDSFSTGQTDSAGRYRLWFDSLRPGVTRGPKLVQIYGAPIAEGDGPGVEGDTSAAVDPLPARYNKESTLRIDVQGPSTTLDFDLRSAGADAGPARR